MNPAAPSEEDPPGPVRVGRLDTHEALRNELARLYRGARRVAGRNPRPADATKLAYLLQAIGASLLARDLEDRIGQIEERLSIQRR